MRKRIIILLLAFAVAAFNLPAQLSYHPYYLGFTPNAEKIVLIGATGIADMFVEVYDRGNPETFTSTRISSYEFGTHYVLPGEVYMNDAYIVIKNRKAGAALTFLVIDISTGEPVVDKSRSQELAKSITALRKGHPTAAKAEGVYQSHIILSEGRFVAHDHGRSSEVTRLNFHDFRGNKVESRVIPVRRGDVYALTEDASMYAFVEPGTIRVFRFDVTDEEVASIPISHENISRGFVGLVLTNTSKGRDLEKLFYLSKSSFAEVRAETVDNKAPFTELTCYKSSYNAFGVKHAWICQNKQYRWLYAGVIRSGKNDVRESLDVAGKSASQLIPLLPDLWSVTRSNERLPSGVVVHNELTHDGSKNYYPSIRYSSFRSNSDNNNNYSTNVYFFFYPEEP
jgi:hypothetical protein